MQLFLERKSKALKRSIREIPIWGSVKRYIFDLSKVFFDEIIASAQQYQRLLKHIDSGVEHSQHMSRLTVWIYAELDEYEKLFGQQVSQLEQNDFGTIAECLK